MASLRQFLNNIFTKDDVRSFILLEIVAGILYSFASILFFIYITNAVLATQMRTVDTAITNFVFQFRSETLTPIMKFFTFLGSDAIVLGFVVTVIILTFKRHQRETFIFGLILSLGVAVSAYFKLLYAIPRPKILALVAESSYSYPSAHALNSSLFYGMLAYFVYHFTKSKPKAILYGIALGLLVAMIGISRIYLGVHHPSDVLAGYIIGFWLMTTTILVDKTVSYFRLISETGGIS